MSEFFMPHGHCYFWAKDILWLHVASDAIIGLSYYSIPAALLYFVRHRKDFAFYWILFLFSSFIFACGTTHFFDIFTTWNPYYRLEGLVKAATALVSVVTAVVLWPLVRKALTLPSPAQLAAANSALADEVGQRKRAEETVLELNRDLERRVEQRTKELEHTNRALQAKADEIARANGELEQFAYAVSHDLKAPLWAINNLSAWIEEDLRDILRGTTREQMDLLRGRIRRMESLLDGLLDYSRAGRLRAEPEKVDTGQLIDEIADLLGPPPGFTIEKTSPMPVFETARAPLQQVLLNLISNAIKHHDRGAGTVEVSAHERNGEVEFVVRDDGPGIPQEFHEKVFMVFQTLKARDELEAAGMGLAIVRKVVEGCGGRATIDGHGEGRGATLRFTWPRQWSSEETAPEARFSAEVRV